MKTPENPSNKRPKKNQKIEPTTSSVSTPEETPVKNIPTKKLPQQPQNVPLIEIDETMMNEIMERAGNAVKSQKIKKYINEQKDAEALRSIIQEYFTSFILVGYSVDNKRLIIKSTNSEKDEDALLEELRFVCYKLSGGN